MIVEVLVTDFASLKEGDTIVQRPCGRCGGEHRATLGELRPRAIGVGSDGVYREGPAFVAMPVPPCCSGWRQWGISELSVKNRLLYRVEAGA